MLAMLRLRAWIRIRHDQIRHDQIRHIEQFRQHSGKFFRST